MPFPNISLPPFPDVPNLPGVPAVPRSLSSAAQALDGGIGGLPTALSAQLTPSNLISLVPGGAAVSSAISSIGTLANGLPGGDALGGLIGTDGPTAPNTPPPVQWGIFDNNTGEPICKPDSILAVEYRNERRISDYPQEQGAFASYNKVAMPYDMRVSMAKGGTAQDRQTFLNAIDTAFKSTNLYNVVTPEIAYVSASIVHYSYRREQRNGAGMIIVEVWLEEVRVTGTATFTSSTQQPSDASTTNGGTVQATTPPAGMTVPTTAAAGVAMIAGALGGASSLSSLGSQINSSVYSSDQISQHISSIFSPNAFH